MRESLTMIRTPSELLWCSSTYDDTPAFATPKAGSTTNSIVRPLIREIRDSKWRIAFTV